MADLSREERETIILSNMLHTGWDITTADPQWVRKLEKLGYTGKPLGDGTYKRFAVPYHAVKVRGPAKPKRQISQSALDNLRLSRKRRSGAAMAGCGDPEPC